MNGERDTEVIDDTDDVEENASPEDTVVITEDLADIDDLTDTAELDIDQLVAKLDATDDAARRKEVHRRLEEMLTRTANYQEKEVDGLIATLLGILQPLLIVMMGAIVLTIVLAILLPIFEINNLIR